MKRRCASGGYRGYRVRSKNDKGLARRAGNKMQAKVIKLHALVRESAHRGHVSDASSKHPGVRESRGNLYEGYLDWRNTPIWAGDEYRIVRALERLEFAESRMRFSGGRLAKT